MALTDNLVWGSKLDGNSNDVLGVSNGTDTAITYSSGNGKLVQGAGFDGSTSRINTNASCISGTGDFTIAVWIKTSTAGRLIASKRAGVTENGQWNFSISGTGNLLFWDYNGSAFQFLTSGESTNTVTDGNWHLVGFSRIGTAGTYWLDGAANGTKTALSNLSYSTTVVRFGSDPYSGTFFNGAQDEAGVWNRALTSAEITSLYNAGQGLQYPFSTSSTFSPRKALLGVGR